MPDGTAAAGIPLSGVAPRSPRACVKRASERAPRAETSVTRPPPIAAAPALAIAASVTPPIAVILVHGLWSGNAMMFLKFCHFAYPQFPKQVERFVCSSLDVLGVELEKIFNMRLQRSRSRERDEMSDHLLLLHVQVVFL